MSEEKKKRKGRGKRKTKHKNISRIDSKNTHGWYVRIYANGELFVSKLFSDKICGGKQNALKYAKLYRDHNRMVADLHIANNPNKKRRKPAYNSPSRRNRTGIVGVNEVHTTIRNRPVHYVEATWSENGKPRSRKFYVTKDRTRDDALEAAIAFRKDRVEELMKEWEQHKKEWQKTKAKALKEAEKFKAKF